MRRDAGSAALAVLVIRPVEGDVVIRVVVSGVVGAIAGSRGEGGVPGGPAGEYGRRVGRAILGGLDGLGFKAGYDHHE